MTHPEKILRALDARLNKPIRLILYGRAALALGFDNVPKSLTVTMDVDAILPEIESQQIEADAQFWSALDQVNKDLKSEGLYFTHLFIDSQIILSPDWLEHITKIDLSGMKYLEIYRPATMDLVLTKMMRVDPQDREDILFLLDRRPVSLEEFGLLVASARVPDVEEIEVAFRTNAEWLSKQIENQGKWDGN